MLAVALSVLADLLADLGWESPSGTNQSSASEVRPCITQVA